MQGVRHGINVLMLIAIVLCALSVVTSQHKTRKLFIELQKEKDQAQQMDVEWGQLRLEFSTWATPARIEQVASRQLRMQIPKNDSVKFVRMDPSAYATALGNIAGPELQTGLMQP